ncbi:tetratricopeptide repeat protein [bacterium]|nr:tetratricopeptide repeat protein [bacterium]
MRKGFKTLLLVLFSLPLLAKEPVSLLLIPISPWGKAGGLESAYITTQNIRQILLSSGWFSVTLFNQYSPQVTQAVDQGVIKDIEARNPEKNPQKIGELFGVDMVLWGKITKIEEKDAPPQASIEIDVNILEVKTKQKENFKLKGEAKGEENTAKRVVLERAILSACYFLQDRLIGREIGSISEERQNKAKDMLQEAEKLISVGKETEALAKLDEASLIDPGNEEIYVALGNCYLKIGDYRRADRQFRIALSLNRRDERAYIGLAKALKGRNLSSAAIAQLRLLLYFFPKSKDGKLLLAQYLREEGDIEAANQLLQELARDYPDDPQLLWELGQSYLGRGQLQSAYAYLKASFSNEPSLEKAETVVKLSLTLERYKEALSLLKKWIGIAKDKMTHSAYIKIMNCVDEFLDKKLKTWTNVRNGLVAGKITREKATEILTEEESEIGILKNSIEQINPPSDFKKSFSSRLFAITSIQSAFVALHSYVEGLGDDKLQLSDILIDSAKRDLALAKFLETK